MKRKGISLLLALVLLLAMAMPAGAADGSFNNFKTVNTYTQEKFRDVPAQAWYGTALQSCYETGLFLGTTTSTFSPSGNLTVAQAIVLADRLNAIYYGGDGKLSAAADGEAWYQPAVDYARAHGILNSAENNAFPKYTVPVTRGQMAYLMANALPSGAYEIKNTISSLPDVTQADLFGSQIFKLYQAGILMGNDSQGTFYPDSFITRAAAAAILARIAFPTQRQTLNLYTSWSVGSTSFAMPAGSTRSVYTDTTTQVDSADGTQMTVLITDTDDNYDGVSITSVAQSTLQSVLKASLASEGLSVSNLTFTTVKFGETSAYRYLFTTTLSSRSVTCCCYFYLDGKTLHLYIAAADTNTQLAAMVNSVTVNGKPVSAGI